MTDQHPFEGDGYLHDPAHEAHAVDRVREQMTRQLGARKIEINVLHDERSHLKSIIEELEAERDQYRLKIASALSWIARHGSKWGGLTLELDVIRDALLGLPAGRPPVDATPGATAPMSGETAARYLADDRAGTFRRQRGSLQAEELK